ncbi:MAG: hypothetical protein AB1540_16870 [Bdellovibrionota bacterium]
MARNKSITRLTAIYRAETCELLLRLSKVSSFPETIQVSSAPGLLITTQLPKDLGVGPRFDLKSLVNAAKTIEDEQRTYTDNPEVPVFAFELSATAQYALARHMRAQESVLLLNRVQDLNVPGFDMVVYGKSGKRRANVSLKNPHSIHNHASDRAIEGIKDFRHPEDWAWVFLKNEHVVDAAWIEAFASSMRVLGIGSKELVPSRIVIAPQRTRLSETERVSLLKYMQGLQGKIVKLGGVIESVTFLMGDRAYEVNARQIFSYRIEPSVIKD